MSARIELLVEENAHSPPRRVVNRKLGMARTNEIESNSGLCGERIGDVAVAGTHAYVADVSSGLQILPAQCDMPTAGELSAFAAAPVPGAILLTWCTSFELEHLGFFLLRSTIADRGYVRVSEMISPPGPYRFLDVDVSVGVTYFYRSKL